MINAAAHVMFLVAGAEKAKMLKAVLGEPSSALTAAMVRPTNGRLLWLIDRAAATLLSPATTR